MTLAFECDRCEGFHTDMEQKHSIPSNSRIVLHALSVEEAQDIDLCGDCHKELIRYLEAWWKFHVIK